MRGRNKPAARVLMSIAAVALASTGTAASGATDDPWRVIDVAQPRASAEDPGTVAGKLSSACVLAAPIAWNAGLDSTDAKVATVAGATRQMQYVAYGPDGTPTRAIARWLASEGQLQTADAGWSWDYRLLAQDTTAAWVPRVRDLPLEQTQYEMYQLDLSHPATGQELGLRLGLRHNGRLYWWQFIRADFIERGPVFSTLRVGGPIYNEESTLQADLYLVLWANGLIEAYAHFINHQRETRPLDLEGVPVIAFSRSSEDEIDIPLDGSQAVHPFGDHQLDLGQSVGYGSPEKPGSLTTEGDVVVYQPWLDQEIYGSLLVDEEGIPDANRIAGQSRGGEDGYWVAKLGDHTFPAGVARTVRFTVSPRGQPTRVQHFDAPGWWHAQRRALPTGGDETGDGYLPVKWWAVPRALEVGADYGDPHPAHGEFMLGCAGRDTDGALGAAMLLLGRATGASSHIDGALLPAYWWADVAVDHTSFTVHELPKYSWQYIVQPYQRFVEIAYAYQETGDPYLLETATFVADAYYRFFKTNRPHRFVGRDALGGSGLLALYELTGKEIYLDRLRDIMAEARRSYGQTEHYWPGHQSGSGPNGVAREPSWDYIPMLLARLHVQMLETAAGDLPPQEEADAWDFVRRMAELVDGKPDGGWIMRATSLAYVCLTALADRYPKEADLWVAMLNRWNAASQTPDEHDGGKTYSWVTSALRFDAWAWGATLRDGTLQFDPKPALLNDPRAPKSAQVWTPDGWRQVRWERGEVSVN